jgi:salicylate hydroxylase
VLIVYDPCTDHQDGLDQGQCESQAIEDAAALSVFLSYLKDKRDVEKRLLGFQKVRRGRAGALQILSNVGQEAEQSQFQELKKAAFHIQGPMPSESRLHAQ